MTTNSCNLRCSYCYEVGKNIATVNVEAIKKALTDEFLSRDFKHYTISFHGGEPFMAFYSIKQICEWIWSNFNDLDISINATTNGTILNHTIKEWLITNKSKFKIILSIDGRAETHNQNRDNSFEKIDLNFILSLYDDRPSAKMTVTSKNLRNLYDNFIYLYKLGFMPDFAIASGVDWNIKNDIPIFEEQMLNIISFYIKNPQIEIGSIFNIPLHKYSPLFKTNGCGYCGTGQTTIAYDTEGHKFPCHTFITDLSKPYNKKEISNIFLKLKNIEKVFQESNCHTCKFSISCSPCFGINYTKRGDFYNLDNDKCAFMKSTIIAAAKLYAIALSHPEDYIWLKNRTSKEIKHLALGIKQLLIEK